MKQYSKFCLSIPLMLLVKAEHQKPPDKLGPLETPAWKWTNITMDYISYLLWTSKGHNVIQVIVDRLTKSTHVLLMRTMIHMDNLAKLYVAEILRLHRVPTFIMSYRDSRPVLRF